MQEFSKRASQKLSKLSDSQIQNLVSEISEQSELLDSIFQSISTGLLVISTDFHLNKINKAAERVLSFSVNPEDARAKSLFVWEIISNEEIARFLKNSFESKRANVREEFSVLTADETVRFLEISITSLAQNKNLVGLIVRIEDTTDKRNQEILLHRMEAMAGLTNIAASVAHEIKNPLGAISVHIQLIQKAVRKKRNSDGKLPEPKFLENYLDVVNQEIDRLNGIVVNFLTAVRPISVKLELVNPNKVIENLVSFFEPEFSSKGILIEKKLYEKDMKLLIDEKFFREVIVNLAQNSLSAIVEKSEALGKSYVGRIQIHTFVKGDAFTILFMDNGGGMDEETVKRVFEPYFTTKADGTGLGMAMSYKIIKELNGDISVNSEKEKGTEFIIRLPIPQGKRALLTFNESEK